jgi:predicted alpha/beta hydrolase family esterase
VRYLRDQFPGQPIVVTGNSLGSASAIFAAGALGHEVAGYFLESPYRDVTSALRNRTNAAPPPFNRIVFRGLQLAGIIQSEKSHAVHNPIDHVRDIPPDVPVTFIAARNDRWCQLCEVTELHHQIESHAKLVVVESDGHGACARADPKRYEVALLGMLNNVGNRLGQTSGIDHA